MAKNIILCFDGTGDWAADHKTNVFLLFEKLERESQAVFYDGGVGTLSEASAMSWWRRSLLRLADLALATGLRNKVLNGYSFLVQNYSRGDTIYLFGFSRGAFTARVLASMIYSFGIVRQEHENLVPYLWQTISNVGNIWKYKEAAALIKGNFAAEADTRVHFLGLFDTVSSVGILERFKTFPYTEKNPAVDIVRHAVSISEERNAFPEMLFTLEPEDSRLQHCDIVEVWFPGVHRDVGGGYLRDNGLPTEVLNWMVREAAGIHYQGGGAPVFVPNDGKRVQIGTFDWYVLAGLYPMRIWDASVKGFRVFWPNLKHVRTIPENGLVHESVVAVANDEKSLFRPVNLPANPVYYGPHSNGIPPVAYRFRIACCNMADFVGITLGIALSTLIAFGLWFRSFGDGAPPRIGWVLLGAFVVYLVGTGFWQKIAVHFPKGLNPASSATWPWLGAAMGVGLLVLFKDWRVLQVGVGIGLLIAAVALVGKRPALRADRAIPFFALPWIILSFLARVVEQLITSDRSFQGALVPASVAYGCLTLWGLVKVVRDRGVAATVDRKSRTSESLRGTGSPAFVAVDGSAES